MLKNTGVYCKAIRPLAHASIITRSTLLQSVILENYTVVVLDYDD